MKTIIYYLIAICYSTGLYGQAPNWVVDPGDYGNLMNINASITGDCDVQGDILAIFDQNDIIRGVSEVNSGNNEFFIIARSNITTGETLYFAFYDSDADTIQLLTTQTIEFSNNSFLGFPDPIIITAPESIEPVSNCKDLTLYLDEEGTISIDPSDVDNASTDNCGISQITLSKSDFSCSDIGTQSITMNVSDQAGNSNSCQSMITVVDTISPLPSCNNIEVYLDAAGSASITTADINNGSKDNCSIQQISLSKTEFDCSELGDNMVTMTTTDNSGNSATCIAMVTVKDTVSPTALCQSVTIWLDSNGEANLTAQQVDNGSFDNCNITERSISKGLFDCSDLGTQSITMTSQDGSGNSNSCQVDVTILDTITPIAKCLSINAYLDNNGSVIVSPETVNNGSTDNCSIQQFQLSKNNFDCTELGPQQVNMMISDVTGIMASCNATITIIDTISPVAVCKNIDVYLDATGSASITTSSINNGSLDNCSIQQMSLSKTEFDCSEIGENMVTMTVTDNSGNSATCTAIVIVQDTVSPAALCQPVTIWLDDNGVANLSAQQIDDGSFDNCNSLSYATSQSQFACTDAGTQNVNLIVTDGSENQSTCQARITVLDTIAPQASCKPLIAYLSDEGTVEVDISQINDQSIDNCAIQNLELSKNTFDCSNLGLNQVTLSVTDQHSNIGSCLSTITIMDTIAPIVICKSVELTLDANGIAKLSVEDINDGSFDNCGITSFQFSQSTFTCADLGTHVIELIAIDGSGNQSSCNASITITDALPAPNFIIGPKMLCQGIQDVNYSANTQGANGIVQWSFTGAGATLTPSANTLTCRIDFDSDATPGQLIATFDGYCTSITQSITVLFADPAQCASLSNCANEVFLSATDLSNDNHPDVIKATSTITAQGKVESDMLIFQAGDAIVLEQEFEIGSGNGFSASIASCQ